MKFTIYMFTNTVNGKRYVGQTKDNIRRRVGCHAYQARRGNKNVFHSAVRKYGMDKFHFQVIETCDTKDRADDLERRWIRVAESRVTENGYNVTAGGDVGALGYKHSAATKAKISALNKGRKRTPEFCAEVKGRMLNMSAETKAKMSASALGKVVSAETRAKMSANTKGRRHSPETRAKMSAWQIGRKMSPESIEKGRATKAANKLKRAAK